MLPTSRVSENRGLRAAPKATQRGRSGFVRRSLLMGVTAAVFATGMTGCMTVHNGFEALKSNGHWNETIVVLRNRNFALKAWHRRKHQFCNQKHNKDFRAGFMAGYIAAADGSDGCTPSFPPKEYWSWEYQSAEGQARTSAWFSGYPYGVQAAEEDGIVNWNQLPMGAGLEAQLAQCGPTNPMCPTPDGQMQPGVPGQMPLNVPLENYPMGAPTPAYPMEMDGFQLPPGAELVPGPVQ